MIIKTEKGMYQIQANHRDAFDKTAFCEKYIEECMDKYDYIVGDISSNILRLKGFDTDPKSNNYYGFIEDYLEVSCAFGCAYYVLKRVKSEAEYEKLKNDKTEFSFEKISITPIQKENFDKESLTLKSSGKGNPKIVIDMAKINSIPKGQLTPDLAEIANQDKASSNNSNKVVVAPKEETTQTYVSASPDFDPSKSNSSKFNRNNQRNKNQGNGNNNNNNNNKNHKNHKNHNKNKNKGNKA